MAEMRKPIANKAIHTKQREIARDMDDIKQAEERRVDAPKQRRIAEVIDRAERRRRAG